MYLPFAGTTRAEPGPMPRMRAGRRLLHGHSHYVFDTEFEKDALP